MIVLSKNQVDMSIFVIMMTQAQVKLKNKGIYIDNYNTAETRT